MKLFVPPWRQESAPYGTENATDLAKMSCTTGYLARGFLAMNEDLRLACSRIEQAKAHSAKEVASLRDEIGRLNRVRDGLLRNIRKRITEKPGVE